MAHHLVTVNPDLIRNWKVPLDSRQADLAMIAASLALISAAVARVDREYGTTDRELRLTDALVKMAKRLEGGE